MEVVVVDSSTLQENHIVSVRLGDTRRQAPLEKLRRHTLKFPQSTEACTEPLKLEVLQVIASSRLVLRPGEASYQIGFTGADAGTSPLSLGIRVQNNNGAGVSEPASAAPSRPTSALPRDAASIPVAGLAKYQDAAAAAREYLEQHGLLKYIQALLHAVIQVRPEDPFEFIIQQLSMCVRDPTAVTDSLAEPAAEPSVLQQTLRDTAAGSEAATPSTPSAMPPLLSPAMTSAPPSRPQSAWHNRDGADKGAWARPPGPAGLAAAAAVAENRRVEEAAELNAETTARTKELENLVESLRTEMREMTEIIKAGQANQAASEERHAEYLRTLEKVQEQNMALIRENEKLKAALAAPTPAPPPAPTSAPPAHPHPQALLAPTTRPPPPPAVSTTTAPVVTEVKPAAHLDKLRNELKDALTAASRSGQLDRAFSNLAQQESPGSPPPAPPLPKQPPALPPAPPSEPPPLPMAQSPASQSAMRTEEARAWAQQRLVAAFETGELARLIEDACGRGPAASKEEAPPLTVLAKASSDGSLAGEMETKKDWQNAGAGHLLGGNSGSLSPSERKNKALEAAEERRRSAPLEDKRSSSDVKLMLKTSLQAAVENGNLDCVLEEVTRGLTKDEATQKRNGGEDRMLVLRRQLKDMLQEATESGSLFQALSQVMRPPSNEEVAIKDVKAQLLDTLRKGCESGELERALTDIKGRTSKSAKPDEEAALKERLKEKLVSASASGALPTMLEKANNQQPPADDESEKANNLQPPADDEALRARLKKSLSNATLNGELKRSLEEAKAVKATKGGDATVSIAKPSSDELKSRLRDTLSDACNSGALTAALNKVRSNEECTQMKLTIQGIDYDQLMSNPALTNSVKTAIKMSVVEDLGNVKQNDVHVELTKGSVVANVKIFGSTNTQVKSSTDLTSSIAAKVSGVYGINAVQSGPITVSNSNSEVAALKARLQSTLQAACESGSLARVLSGILPPKSSNNGDDSTEAVESLKRRLRDSFTASCSSGEFARVLNEIRPAPQKQGNEVDELRTRLRKTLSDSCQSGELERVLGEKVNSTKNSAPELKMRLRATLQQSCDSGALAQALRQVFPSSAPKEIERLVKEKVELREALSASVESGALDRALQKLHAASPEKPFVKNAAEVKKSLKESLQNSCQSGELARALSEIFPTNANISMDTQDLEQVKARIRAVLTTSVDSGALDQALKEATQAGPSSASQDVAKTKMKLRSVLTAAADSGDLARAVDSVASKGPKAVEAEGPKAMEADVDQLKKQLRNALKSAYSSGVLARALSQVVAKPKEMEKKNDAAQLKKRLRTTLVDACETGSLSKALSLVASSGKSDKTEIKQVKLRLQDALKVSCESGDLARALSMVMSNKETDVQVLKARLRDALKASCETGELAQVLTNTLPNQEMTVEEAKIRLRDALIASCESGLLTRTLNEILPTQSQSQQKADVEEIRLQLRKTLQDGVKSGELGRALGNQPSLEQRKARVRDMLQKGYESGDLGRALTDQMTPGQTQGGMSQMEESKARIQDMLRKSCENGELARALSDVRQGGSPKAKVKPTDGDADAIEKARLKTQELLGRGVESGELARIFSEVKKEQRSKDDAQVKVEQDFKNRLRHSMMVACDSGQLAQALSRVMSRKTGEPQDVQPKAERPVPEPKVEELKGRLRSLLQNKCESGELATALDNVMAPKSVDESSVRNSDLPQASSKLIAEAPSDRSASIKDNLKQLLKASAESGDLSRALKEIRPQTSSAQSPQQPETKSVGQMKVELREVLAKACSSGSLAQTLNEVIPKKTTGETPVERSRIGGEPHIDGERRQTQAIKERLRGVLASACDSGELARALSGASQEASSSAAAASSSQLASPAPALEEVPSSAAAAVSPQVASPAPALEEIGVMRNQISALGEDNTALKRQLQEMMDEMSKVRNQNQELAEKLRNHTHGEGHGHGASP